MATRRKVPIRPKRSVSDLNRSLRYKLAGEVANGLLASRGQYPLEGLKENADEYAKTVMVLVRALEKRLEEED